jgi:hypothetical protein
MEAATLKKIRISCLVFAVLWFVVLAMFEARYLIKLSRVQPNLRAVLGIAYEDQIEGINFFVMLMYFAPGIFSWFVYRRFRKY